MTDCGQVHRNIRVFAEGNGRRNWCKKARIARAFDELEQLVAKLSCSG
jgi:hypothetical protein